MASLSPPSVKRQLVVLDVLSTRATVAAALGFFLALVLVVVVGAVGPYAVLWSEATVSPTCADPAQCLVVGRFSMSLTPLNQATWLTARIQRPTDASGALIEPNAAFSWLQNYTVSVTGDGALLTDLAPHTSTVTCPPKSAACSPLFVFAASHITYSEYKATISMLAPTRMFPGVLSGSPVSIVLRSGTIDPKYTSFQLGWKTTFCVSSALLLAYYCARVGGLIGKGARDAGGELLAATTAQKWVGALGVLLFFFNDPSFLSYITKPDLGVSGFYAVCSNSFLAALLMYWLVQFDLARLQGEQGLGYSVEDEVDPRKRPGACFWVPKVLLIAVFWTISVASYMYARFMQASDPSFSLVESVGGAVAAWFATFIAGLLAVYVLYAFGLLVLCFRLFRTLRAPARFVVAVTVTALLFTLVGLFLGSFTALRETSALFLASFGSANIYVATLMLLHLPAEVPAGAGAGASAAGAAGAGAESAGAAAAAAAAAVEAAAAAGPAADPFSVSSSSSSAPAPAQRVPEWSASPRSLFGGRKAGGASSLPAEGSASAAPALPKRRAEAFKDAEAPAPAASGSDDVSLDFASASVPAERRSKRDMHAAESLEFPAEGGVD